MAEEKAPIIVIKKIKKHGHGHHGGAWKVAYADFVTAMMAFFLLLWLLSSVNKSKLEGIAQYFTASTSPQNQRSMGFQAGKSSDRDSLMMSQFTDPSAATIPNPTESTNLATQDSTSPQLTQQESTSPLNIEKALEQALKDNTELKDFQKRVIFDQTPEGMRIQLLEDSNKPLFTPGTSELQPYTKEILKIIGDFVKFLPNYLSIEGHTTPFQIETNMSDNWKLSSDRANSTRRFLRSSSIENEQVFRVVGKADQEPLYPTDPSDLRNIRISLIILKNSIVPYAKKSFPHMINEKK